MRSVDELKDRYYFICSMVSKIRNEDETKLSRLYRFDSKHEKIRKEQLLKLAWRNGLQVGDK